MIIKTDSSSHPLYGIDEIDWSQWHTAYGNATDTKWNLKRLVNAKSLKTKKSALWNLHASVYHQGDNYSVIPIALDYLIRILKAGCLANTVELDLLCLVSKLGRLDLLRGIWITTGIPNKDDLTRFLLNYYSADEVATFHQAYGKMEDLRDYCFDKIGNHKNYQFRCQCIHILMYLQKDQESIITLLQHRYSIEKNRNVRLSIIWAIAFIATHLPPEKQRHIYQWILLHRPLKYRGVTSHIFTLAELYLGDITSEIQNRVIQMIRDNLEYPFLLDQYRFGADDLVEMSLLLIKIKSNPSHKLFDFFKEVIKTHFHFMDSNKTPKKVASKIDLIFEILINNAFNQILGLYPYWSDHSWQEQQRLRSQLNANQVETLTFLCLHPIWLNHNTSFLMGKLRLPESYDEIALFLGWLPEFDHWKQKDQFFNKPQIEQLPELKPIIDYCGLIPFIENFFPLTADQLINFKSVLNWKNPSANSSIEFTSDLICQHQDLWDWKILSKNLRVEWNADLLSLFADRVDWDSISKQHLNWNTLFIKQFTDYWDWPSLSLNQSLPWSMELIDEFMTDWDWQDLSSNPALPWSTELIDRFADNWDWEELSQNEALPWSEDFFNRYAKRWWHYKDALSKNSKIPWTEDRLKKFDDSHWKHLSKNNGVPWSESFIEKNQDKVNWHAFSKVTHFNWTEAFIEQHKDDLAFSHLAENRSLPWSTALINAYRDKWNWYSLSKNPELPFSAKLLEKFEEHWDWSTLVYYSYITWSADAIAILKRHMQKISRIKGSNFPWTLELVYDPAFAFAFDPKDKSLYQKVIAPLLNEENVSFLLSNYQSLYEEQKRLRKKHFENNGPEIAQDHPLRKILNID